MAVQFDLASVGIAGGPVVPTNESFIVQGAHKAGDSLFVSRYDTSSTANETAHYFKLNGAGATIEKMTILDGGHGTGFFVEQVGSKFFLWCRADSYASGTVVRRTARIPWTPGAVLNDAGLAPYILPGLTGEGVDHVLCFDAASQIVGVRTRSSDTSTRLRTFTLADLKANNVSSPLTNVVVTPPGNLINEQQCMIYEPRSNQWLQLTGPPGGTQIVITGYDGATGAVRGSRNFTDATTSLPDGTRDADNEPEALFTAVTATGESIVYMIVATGPLSARKNIIYSLSPAFHSPGVLDAGRYAASPWVTNGFTPASGVTTPASNPIVTRLVDGYLEVNGRLDITLPLASSVTLGTFDESFRPSPARSVAVARNSTSANPSGAVVRLEITSAGLVLIYPPSSDTAATTWIQFAGVRMPLAVPLTP